MRDGQRQQAGGWLLRQEQTPHQQRSGGAPLCAVVRLEHRRQDGTLRRLGVLRQGVGGSGRTGKQAIIPH